MSTNPLDRIIDEAPDEPQPLRRDWQARVRLITRDFIYLSASTEFHSAGPSLVVEFLLYREPDMENRLRRLPYYCGTMTERKLRFAVDDERFRAAYEHDADTPDTAAADAVKQLAALIFNVERKDVDVMCPDDDDEIPF